MGKRWLRGRQIKGDDRLRCAEEKQTTDVRLVGQDWPKLTYLSERANGNSGRVPASTGADERPTATATAAEPKSLIRRQQQRRLNERRREGSDGRTDGAAREGGSLAFHLRNAVKGIVRATTAPLSPPLPRRPPLPLPLPSLFLVLARHRS